jgi:hypothetical protein
MLTFWRLQSLILRHIVFIKDIFPFLSHFGRLLASNFPRCAKRATKTIFITNAMGFNIRTFMLSSNPLRKLHKSHPKNVTNKKIKKQMDFFQFYYWSFGLQWFPGDVFSGFESGILIYLNWICWRKLFFPFLALFWALKLIFFKCVWHLNLLSISDA